MSKDMGSPFGCAGHGPAFRFDRKKRPWPEGIRPAFRAWGIRFGGGAVLRGVLVAGGAAHVSCDGGRADRICAREGSKRSGGR